MSRNFSLVCSLLFQKLMKRNCHETASLGRDCIEPLGKSSLILNSPQTVPFQRKDHILIFSFDQENVWGAKALFNTNYRK